MTWLTFDKIVLVLLCLVPGFVAHRVYSLRCPTPKQDLEKMALEFMAYSLVNFVFWMWLLVPFLRTPWEEWALWQMYLIVVIVCFVSPALLALLWSWLRAKKLHRWLGMDHPTPRGWDHFFPMAGECFILFHLKGGKKMGGYYGNNSLASMYPQEPEVYVEELWRLDEE